jgi:DNA/RNA endonuclease YhcR with UshA esterase domain
MSWSKKSKYIIITFFVGGIVGLFVVTKIMYAPHEKTEDTEAFFKGKAANFITNINTDTTLTAGITVELLGEVTNVKDSTAVINNNIFCQFSGKKITFKTGDSITVKGRFIGYDDLMEEVKMDKCIQKK